MLDIRQAKATIAYRYQLPTARAIQAQAHDYETGEWYCSQGMTSGAVEDAQITRGAVADSSGLVKKISVMQCVDADHPDTISVLRRDGVLGIVLNWHGVLSWLPYHPGKALKAETVPILGGKGDAYIDAEAQTVCIRTGSTFRLYELNGDQRGKQIGKTISGVDQPGPGQGFWTMKTTDGFQLFAGFGYGKRVDKQYIESCSFVTGKMLYAMQVRMLPDEYTTQEPESGFGLNGVPYLGMSTYRKGRKQGVALRLEAVEYDPNPPPPPPPVPVTMWVRPAGDPIWTDPAPNKITARKDDGSFTKPPVTKTNDEPVTGVGVMIKVDGKPSAALRVKPNENWRLEFLSAIDPTTPVPDPAPEVPQP
jgi:hypothetical protein